MKYRDFIPFCALKDVAIEAAGPCLAIIVLFAALILFPLVNLFFAGFATMMVFDSLYNQCPPNCGSSCAQPLKAIGSFFLVIALIIVFCPLYILIYVLIFLPFLLGSLFKFS